MKRIVSALAAGAVAVTALLGAVAPASAQQDTIEVGVLAPLTGRNAVQGEDILRGIQLAVERINNGYQVPLANGETVKVGPEELGGRIELIVEDNESRPASALAAVRKLVNVNNVPIVLGILSSGVCVPTGEFTNENETVEICSSSTSPQLRDIGPYHFSAMGLDKLMGQALAEFAYKDSGAERYATLSANNPFGVGMEIQACRALKNQYDAECVTKVRYQQGKSDYRPDLRRVISQDPGKALLTAYGTDARLILQQAFQLGIDPSLWYADYMTLWANEVTETPQVADGIKGLIVGSSGEFYRSEYAEAYEQKFGEPPTTAFGGYAYDSAMVTALAIKEAGEPSSDAIRDALYKVSKNYKGVTGGKAFDKDGMQVNETYQKVIYKDGKLVPYEMEGN